MRQKNSRKNAFLTLFLFCFPRSCLSRAYACHVVICTNNIYNKIFIITARVDILFSSVRLQLADYWNAAVAGCNNDQQEKRARRNIANTCNAEETKWRVAQQALSNGTGLGTLERVRDAFYTFDLQHGSVRAHDCEHNAYHLAMEGPPLCELAGELRALGNLPPVSAVINDPMPPRLFVLERPVATMSTKQQEKKETTSIPQSPSCGWQGMELLREEDVRLMIAQISDNPDFRSVSAESLSSSAESGHRLTTTALRARAKKKSTANARANAPRAHYTFVLDVKHSQISTARVKCPLALQSLNQCIDDAKIPDALTVCGVSKVDKDNAGLRARLLTAAAIASSVGTTFPKRNSGTVGSRFATV